MSSLIDRVNEAMEQGRELRREAKALEQEYSEGKRQELLDQISHGSGPTDPAVLRAQAELQYFIASFQVNSAERGARQLAIATWVLAFATVGLFVATIILATKGG